LSFNEEDEKLREKMVSLDR